MSGTTNEYVATVVPSGGVDTSGCSRIVKTDINTSEEEIEIKNQLFNGDYLPNNNVCETNQHFVNMDTNCEVMTTGSSEQGGSSVRTEDECRDEGEDSLSLNQSEDTCSTNDADSITSQEANTSELSITHDEYSFLQEDEDEHSNGVLRRTSSKKKKLAGGTGKGRAKKGHVALYHSQISGDKNTIKIRIKKSNYHPQSELPPTKRKSARRKKHKSYSDTDTSDYEKRPKRSRPSTGDNNSDMSKQKDQEPLEQSVWGDNARMPPEILSRIFEEVQTQDGALPSLIRLCKVCRLWRDVSLMPSIWKKADLNCVKEKDRKDLRLHWLILNRLTECEDIQMGEWKLRDIQSVLKALSEHCTKLKGLNLSGWKGLNADNLKFISSELKKLERIDLSAINSASAINAQPLVALSQSMNTRLTHLVLAHNKIAGCTLVLSAIAAHCPNLQLLDISNIRTFAHNSALLHVEKLQTGCPQLKVLRMTNSQIWLAPTTLAEQVASPGFPLLEELSLAGLEEDQTTTSRSMDDDGIGRILKNSRKLRLLDVRGCSKLTDSGLVRVPAWDLEHLFLSACYITRLQNSGLELIVQKWGHSILEVDLAWSTATSSLDAAVMALAEKGPESKLRILNLCGSSVSLGPVKAVLTHCPQLYSINLQSCRALPRGIKRLYTGDAVAELRNSLNEKPKTEDGESGTETSSPKNE